MTRVSDFERLGHLTTAELLEALEICYPQRCPDPADTEREIWMKAGERRLVNVLKSKYEDANEVELHNVL